jgi:hypothetical protein
MFKQLAKSFTHAFTYGELYLIATEFRAILLC